MSDYNDGLTQALGDYIKELGIVGNKAIEALKEQIDIETDMVERDLIDNTPENTSGLKRTLNARQ
jgi:hypothetical protein